MKLETIISDSAHSYIYMERYVNDGSPSGLHNSTSKKTCPKGPYKKFGLKLIEFDKDIQSQDFGQNQFGWFFENTMLLHPDMLYSPIIKRLAGRFKIVDHIHVAPTSSGRTVLFLKTLDGFAKLSYDKILGRMFRQMHKNSVLASREVSCALASVAKSGRLNPSFSFLKEDFGRVCYLPYKDDSLYEWGVTFRDYMPYPPSLDKHEYLVPFFSLFSLDRFHPEDLPILCQLFQKQNKTVEDFLFCDLLAPLYSCYFDVLINCGIGLEAHAQNTMLTIDSTCRINRIVAKDLESADRDLPLMNHLGMTHDIQSQPYKCLYKDQYNYQIMHSFMFDFKLGEYIVTPVIECMKQYYRLDEQKLINRLKDHNAEFISKLPEDYFPDVWYSYTAKVHEPDKKRPYIAHKNPKYR